MKIRNGFVSNSSSSSFVVKLDNINLECENCKKILQSLFAIASAREIVVKYYGYNTWEEFLEEVLEGANYKTFIVDAVKSDKKIAYANVEYGNEGSYYKILDTLKVEYEVD